MGWACRCTNGMVLFISYIYHVVFGNGADGVAPGPRRWAVMLIAVFAPSTIAMLTAECFGFFGAVVDKNGSVNHIQLIPPRMVRQCYGWVYAFGGADVAIEAGLPLVVINIANLFNHILLLNSNAV